MRCGSARSGRHEEGAMCFSPVVGSSSPDALLTGHSTFSAPSSFRTFFQSVFESTDEGRPEMTTVRIANGSDGAAGFRGGRGGAGFFCFSSLGVSWASWSLFCRRRLGEDAYVIVPLTTHPILGPLNPQCSPIKHNTLFAEALDCSGRVFLDSKSDVANTLRDTGLLIENDERGPYGCDVGEKSLQVRRGRRVGEIRNKQRRPVYVSTWNLFANGR